MSLLLFVGIVIVMRHAELRVLLSSRRKHSPFIVRLPLPVLLCH